MMEDPQPAASGEHFISMRNLTRSYGRNAPVLSGIDIENLPGERVAQIGANGSGKSTPLKSIIDLHAISSGTVSTLGDTFSE